jgi:hypothetical protein
LVGGISDRHFGQVEWTVKSPPRHLLDVLGEDFPESEVREALNTFCDARLMLSEGDKFLSLAIPANQN